MQNQGKGLWLSYSEITRRTAEQIERYLADSRRRTGSEALIRQEWAYGAYMGWRVLAEDMSDNATFLRDARMLESLLSEKEAPSDA